MPWIPLAAAALGAGASIYGASQAGKQGAAPPPRNVGNELDTIQGYLGPYTQNGYDNAAMFNPAYTGLNLGTYNQAMGGVAPGMRDYYNQANPGLSAYTSGLGDIYNRVSGNRPTGVGATGYDAATSQGMSAGNAFMAQLGGPQYQAIAGPQQAANAVYGSVVGPDGYDRVSAQTGFDRVRAQQGDVGLSTATNRMLTGGPSDIQGSLENQARSDLALGGALSAEEQRNAQQAAREAGASRGLINSNSTVAAEILNRDAASRARQNERRGFAAAVDQTGFGQRQAGIQSALGVSNAAQNYSQQGLAAQQANLGAQLQGNALNLQGQMANQSGRNAFNQQGLTANLANQDAALRASLANQQRDLTMNQQRLATGQSNQTAGLGYANLFSNNSQFNAGANNQMNQFNAQLGQQNNQFNANANNQAQQFNTGAVNDMNRFNQQLNFAGNQNDWTNAMQYGNFQLGQALDPFSVGRGLMGQTPDYTNALLGYGNGVYDTNYNGQAAANNAQRNSGGAMFGAGMGLVGQGLGAYGSYAGMQGGGGRVGATGATNQNPWSGLYGG